MSTEKKKPGRPKKVTDQKVQKINGIVDYPTNSKYLAEVECSNPSNFKKICNCWKAINAKQINWKFTPDKLVLSAIADGDKDHKDQKRVVIRTTIDGSRIISHYCPTPISIDIPVTGLEALFNRLDKKYDSIGFIIQSKSERMTILLTNENEITEHLSILCTMSNDIDHYMNNLYISTNDTVITDPIFDNSIVAPIKFKLDWKYFKKTISNTAKFEKDIAIQHNMDHDGLTFTYTGTNTDAAIIPPRSKMPELEVDPQLRLTVSIHNVNLKPISTSCLAPFIYFKAWSDRDLWLWTILNDDAITIDISVPIVDYSKSGNRLSLM